jgi:hypothetical protein
MWIDSKKVVKTSIRNTTRRRVYETLPMVPEELV